MSKKAAGQQASSQQRLAPPLTNFWHSGPDACGAGERTALHLQHPARVRLGCGEPASGPAMLRPAGLFLAVLGLATCARAAIHPYSKEFFYSVGDAYIFRGGREGLYASTPEVRPSTPRTTATLCTAVTTSMISLPEASAAARTPCAEDPAGLLVTQQAAAHPGPSRLVLSILHALTTYCWPNLQAMEKWGYWERIGPGVANGQSEIKFTQLEFTRPADIAQQFDPNEGFTGLVQVPPSP